MTCEEATQQIPEAKKEKGLAFESAVDFILDIEREEEPAGDRVKVTCSGKFLPYRKW